MTTHRQSVGGIDHPWLGLDANIRHKDLDLRGYSTMKTNSKTHVVAHAKTYKTVRLQWQLLCSTMQCGSTQYDTLK